MEYFVDTTLVLGVPIRTDAFLQKNIIVYHTAGNTGMDVHVSIRPFHPADQAALDAMLARAVVVDNFSSSAADELRCGLVLLGGKDRKAGLAGLQRATDLELRTPALSSAQWTALINAQAREYLDHNDGKLSREICATGLAREPDNPRLHYAAARAAASGSRRDAVVLHLRAAHSHAALLPAGEILPDPALDPAFADLHDNAAFATVVREVQPPVLSTTPSPFVLSLPDTSVAVKLDLTGYKIDRHQLKVGADGSVNRSLVATNPHTRVRIIAIIFKADSDKIDSAEKVRRISMQYMEDWNSISQRHNFAAGAFAGTRYLTKATGDFGPIKNRCLELFHGDGRVTAMILCVQPESDLIDDAPLRVAAAAVELPKDYRAGAIDEMLFGHNFYRARDYVHARDHYTRALELDQASHELPRDQWFVLVDMLAFSYSATGDHAGAAAVCRQGLAVVPDDPLFSYYLACSCAAQGDLEGTVRNLATAFRNRVHLQPNQKLPDPAGDEAFKRYLTEPKFLQVLIEINRLSA
jgi:tetratricopeptide (TPR) repeat protein